jgi:hypothetical protein
MSSPCCRGTLLVSAFPVMGAKRGRNRSRPAERGQRNRAAAKRSRDGVPGGLRRSFAVEVQGP